MAHTSGTMPRDAHAEHAEHDELSTVRHEVKELEREVVACKKEIGRLVLVSVVGSLTDDHRAFLLQKLRSQEEKVVPRLETLPDAELTFLLHKAQSQGYTVPPGAELTRTQIIGHIHAHLAQRA